MVKTSIDVRFKAKQFGEAGANCQNFLAADRVEHTRHIGNGYSERRVRCKSDKFNDKKFEHAKFDKISEKYYNLDRNNFCWLPGEGSSQVEPDLEFK